MPRFRTIVEGQNFHFRVDDEVQVLDFYRTLCLDADNAALAKTAALDLIRVDLLAQDMWRNEEQPAASKISVEHIEQVDVLDRCDGDRDFVWHFPDDALFEHKLRN